MTSTPEHVRAARQAANQFVGAQFGAPKRVGGKSIQPAREPEQLKMFMTPREIEEKWAPLDGDREEVPMQGSDGFTGQRRTEGSLPSNYMDPPKTDSQGLKTNRKWYTPGGRDRAWSQGEGQWAGRHLSQSKVYKYGMESDDQLWDRKVEEAYDSDRAIQPKRPFELTERSHTTGGRSNLTLQSWENSDSNGKYGYERHSWEESLGDSIERTGVQKPIHLSRQIGSTGKPEIVGGHHRMAVQRHVNPDQLMPVLHHESFWDARQMTHDSPWGKYT